MLIGSARDHRLERSPVVLIGERSSCSRFDFKNSVPIGASVVTVDFTTVHRANGGESLLLGPLSPFLLWI